MSVPSSYSADDIVQLLEHQATALAAVLNCLEEERDALVARDPEALDSVTARKAECLNVVDGLEKQRRRIAPTLAEMEALTLRPAVQEPWERVLVLTRQCRELNEANGRMINRQRQRVDATLHLLRGDVSEPIEYGPDGAGPRRRSGRSTLASA